MFETILPFSFSNRPDQQDSASIRIGIARFLADGQDGAPAYAHPVDPEDGLLGVDPSHWMSGDIFLRDDPYQTSTARVGSIDYMNILHEMGHAFGLKHGHTEEELDGILRPGLPASHDSVEFSVMTYRSFVGGPTVGSYSVANNHYPQTLMMLDIAALQSLYGADFTTRSDDTIYRWDPTDGKYWIDGLLQFTLAANVVFSTVWDGGGVDTYDFSAYGSNINASLYPGGWIHLNNSQMAALALDGAGVPTQQARGNVFNALQYEGSDLSLIENIATGSGKDFIIGNDVGNRIDAGDGDDSIFGGAGDDILIGGRGRDEIYGGTGTDLAGYIAAKGVSVEISQLGPEKRGSWHVEGTGEGRGDYLIGIQGFLFGDGDDEIAITGRASVALYGAGGDDSLFGGRGVDSLFGDAGSDQFTPGEGRFDIYGGTARADGGWIETLADNDLLIIDRHDQIIAYTLGFVTGIGYGRLGGFYDFAGSEARGIARIDYTGGRGIDEVGGGLGDDVIRGGRGDDLIDGGSGADQAYGGSHRDSIYLGSGNDTARGDAGDDYIDGSAGRDTLYGGDGDDYIRGGSGGDRIYSGRGGDVGIFGEGGGDYIEGSDDAEQLFGGGGGDRIVGGGGDDLLTGGDGRDRFIFGPGHGRDTILDFDARAPNGQDVIDLRAHGYGGFGAMLRDGVRLRAEADGTRIDFGRDGGEIFLSAVDKAQVEASDFLF